MQLELKWLIEIRIIDTHEKAPTIRFKDQKLSYGPKDSFKLYNLNPWP